MAGDQKIPRDRDETGEPHGLAFHLIAIIAAAVVILIIAGGIFLGDAGKNPPQVPAETSGERDILYQVSTYDALMLGAYTGVLPVSEIKKHGDTGTGTFEGLDGEMIAIDGQYYHVTSDGDVHEAVSSEMVPFGSVTFFDNDTTMFVSGGRNLTSFTGEISKGLPSKNLIYAIRVDATLPEVVVRAIPRQEKPYPLFTEAATHQSVFRLKNTSGTIVGFYLPKFIKGVNLPGYHLHYISADRKSAGHILDLTSPDSTVQVVIDQTADFSMSTPTTPDFTEINFTDDISGDIHGVVQKFE